MKKILSVLLLALIIAGCFQVREHRAIILKPGNGEVINTFVDEALVEMEFTFGNEYANYTLTLVDSKERKVEERSGKFVTGLQREIFELPVGVYTAYLKAVFSDSETVQSSTSFTVNAVPTVELLSPTDGSTVTIDDAVSWEAFDKDGTITRMVLKIKRVSDGILSTISTDSTTVPLESIETVEKGNEYRWWVEVEDDKGATRVSEAWTFEIPNGVPNLSVSASGDLENARVDEPIVFTVSASDPDGDTLEFGINVNGETVVITSGSLVDLVWDFLPEPDSTYTIVFSLSDGIENVERVFFVRSTRSPIVELIFPQNGEELFSDNNSLIWNVNDPDGDDFTQILELVWDGGSTEINVEGFSYPLKNLERNRNYSWSLVVTDSRGASTVSETRYFELRNRLPEISMKVNPSVKQNAYVNVPYEISLESSDEDEDLLTLILKVNGEMVAVSTGLQEASLSYSFFLNPGEVYDVEGQVQDGFDVSRVNDIIRATKPPTITILSPEDGARYSTDEWVTFQWSASDEDGDSLSFVLHINGESTQMEYPVRSQSVDLRIDSPGTYTWWVEVFDDRGASSTSETREITIESSL